MNIFDICCPEGVARVALFAGWECGVVSRRALVAKNTGDSDPTDTLAGFRVTCWAFSSIQVAVTS